MSQSSYYTSVNQSAPIGTSVITTQALGSNGIVYSLSNTPPINRLFSISNSGEISVAADLRTDDAIIHTFYVEAAVPECSVSAQVSVRVVLSSSVPVIHIDGKFD